MIYCIKETYTIVKGFLVLDPLPIYSNSFGFIVHITLQIPNKNISILFHYLLDIKTIHEINR